MQTHTNNEMNAVEAAENKIAALRNGLINGDQKIKPSDLAAAQSELEFAKLQHEAAELAKEKAEKAERRAKLLELQKELAAVNDSRSGVDKKFAALEKSLADYLQTATVYQKSLNRVRTELQAANFYHSNPPGVIEGIQTSDIRRTLEIGDVAASNYDPHEVIKPLIEQALADFDWGL